MDIVFARATAYVLSPTGQRKLIQIGQHWPANDPIVKQYPEMFSTDSSYGLEFSAPPDVAEPVETVKLPQPKRVETATKKVDPSA